MIKIILLFSIFLSQGAVFSQTTVLKDSIVYVCPPCNRDCDKMKFDKAGNCPHCGMPLLSISLKDFEKWVSRKDITICFYLQNNVEVLDFAGPLEVFDAAGFKVFIVSKTKEKITAQGVLTVVPDYNIEDAPQSDVLVFFGGETEASVHDSTLISWIQTRKKATDYILSVCTGAFIIGKAGVLDHLTATTYHTAIDDLQHTLPTTKVLSKVRFVDNGRVITTAGVSAGIDGALYLVEKLRGRSFASYVAAMIEYDKWIPGQGLIIQQN